MAANTYAQVPASVNGAGVTSISRTFSSACTSGTVIAAACITESGSVTLDVTDNGGNTYTSRLLVDNASHCVVGISDTTNTSTAAVQVTLTFKFGGSPASCNGAMQVYEITNAGGSPAYDANGSQAANAAVSFNVVTTAANDTIISCIADQGSDPGSTVDTGYTSRSVTQGGAFSFMRVEDNIDVGAAGTKTLTYGSHSGNFAVAAAAYKPPGGGGGGGVTFPELERGIRGLNRGVAQGSY